VTDATTGVKREDIPLFLEMLKESVNLPSPSLSNKFGQILQQLTTDCKSGGLTSTVYGNLDRKTAMYGLFHCVKEPEDTLSVFYTIHTLSTEFERDNVQTDLLTERGFMEEVQLGKETTENYLATSAAKELLELGIDISRDTISVVRSGVAHDEINTSSKNGNMISGAVSQQEDVSQMPNHKRKAGKEPYNEEDAQPKATQESQKKKEKGLYEDDAQSRATINESQSQKNKENGDYENNAQSTRV